MYTWQSAELYSEEAYAAAQFRVDTRGGVNSKTGLTFSQRTNAVFLQKNT